MVSMVGPKRLYRLLIDLTHDHIHWRVRVTQTVLMAKLGCTLRTLQRWTAQLRQAGWITTRQSIDSRGYNSVNIYDLLIPPTDDDLGGPGESNKEPGDAAAIAAGLWLKGASRCSEAAPAQVCPISEKRTEEPVVRRAVEGQLSLFEFDAPTAKRKTKPKPVSKSAAKPRTPANDIMAYWLSGRVKRPSRGAVAGMAGAVTRCLQAGIAESEIRVALDALMRRDLDWSYTQLLAYFNLAHSTAKPCDYTAEPLRKRQPRRSAMTAARTTALARSEEAEREATRSFARRMVERLRSSTDSSSAGDTVQPTPAAPLPEHRRAVQEELYVQQCREAGRNPVKSSKGVTAALVARLRAQMAGAQ